MGRISSFRDLNCLVTGASAGIGRELALLLADEGARLAITARRLERLESLAGELTARGAAAVVVVPEDLADPAAPERLVERVETELGPIDVLVNNAGFSVPGFFHRGQLVRQRAMVQVNVASATDLARLCLPGMIRRGRGGMLTLASMAGYVAAPYQSGYAGTKAYLLNLSSSVHQELKRTPLAITALCPGVTDTEFFDVAGYRNLQGFMNRRMSAERVARVGLRAFRKGRMEVVPGFLNRTLIVAQRFVPRSWVAAISRRLMGKRELPSGQADSTDS